jgi:hypothetical protein
MRSISMRVMLQFILISGIVLLIGSTHHSNAQTRTTQQPEPPRILSPRAGLLPLTS